VNLPENRKTLREDDQVSTVSRVTTSQACVQICNIKMQVEIHKAIRFLTHDGPFSIPYICSDVVMRVIDYMTLSYHNQDAMMNLQRRFEDMSVKNSSGRLGDRGLLLYGPPGSADGMSTNMYTIIHPHIDHDKRM
jgi:hypothetical protein